MLYRNCSFICSNNLYTRRLKLSTTFIYLLKQFSNYREEIISYVEKSLSVVKLCINIQARFLVHVIVGCCCKAMSFIDLSKLHATALKSSKSNPQHLETCSVPFSHKMINIYSCTQSCNENKLTLMRFFLNSPSDTLANCMIVSLSYRYIMYLSLSIRFTYIT